MFSACQRMVLLALLLLLIGAGCKVPLDERQAVAELEKKTLMLEQELESGAARQLTLGKEFAALRLKFDDVRDQLLKQDLEIKALNRAQIFLQRKIASVQTANKGLQASKSVEKPRVVFSPEESQAFEALYDDSMVAYRNGDYESAVKLFAAYLRDFPDTAKAANARYWLGESYYSLAQYAQAITEFKRVRKDFPGSAKDRDALLKTAMSFEAIGSNTPAQAAYTELLQRYPSGESARRAEKALARFE
ncbi:tol-pal system protein YbgF [bacterium]|nr:tol-pal system protein YbgF [bacterium]